METRLEGTYTRHGWRDDMKLLANTDDEGNITQSVYGEFVMDPDNAYEHHLDVTHAVLDNIEDYKIKDNKLIKR